MWDYGTADDALIEAYLRCSKGADTLTVVDCDGRTARAFGVPIADDDLDSWFRFTSDGMTKLVTE